MYVGTNRLNITRFFIYREKQFFITYTDNILKLVQVILLILLK